jgi:quinol-cytochrome oxidoreductase complex cytochrome b subunit
MSPLMLVGACVVIAASVALVLIGERYKWDLTSVGYEKWTRVTGVIAVLAFAALTAWGQIKTPLVSVAIFAGGVALSVAFVVAHRGLTARVRDQLSSRNCAE